jgi:hypothetical protein
LWIQLLILGVFLSLRAGSLSRVRDLSWGG